LIEDGRARSIIVTPDRTHESQVTAATELQEHLKLMADVKLPIVKESELSDDTADVLILVGPSRLAHQRLGIDPATLPPESFVVKTTDDALVLVQPTTKSRRTNEWSDDKGGSLNAVYAWLRTLGVRRYMPGELGEVVPEAQSIASIETGVQTTEPIVRWRGVSHRMVRSQ
jgi:hypothetical protein